MNEIDKPPSVEERRIKVDEERLSLDKSFARKWFPTLVTLVVGFIAAVFGYVQHTNTTEATERARIDAGARDTQARIEARPKDEREWGFKVVEMYFENRDLFDFTKDPKQAAENLRVLSAVAPTAVQGLLNAEQSRISAPGSPSEGNDEKRLASLAAVAEVQSAINSAKGGKPRPVTKMVPSDFTVYIQYAEGSRDVALGAQEALQQLGYQAPGIEKVSKVPSRLQVRYYRPEQKDFAGALAIKLGHILRLNTTADNAIRVTSEKQLPSGILELWLPR